MPPLPSALHSGTRVACGGIAMNRRAPISACIGFVAHLILPDCGGRDTKTPRKFRACSRTCISGLFIYTYIYSCVCHTQSHTNMLEPPPNVARAPLPSQLSSTSLKSAVQVSWRGACLKLRAAICSSNRAILKSEHTWGRWRKISNT